MFIKPCAEFILKEEVQAASMSTKLWLCKTLVWKNFVDARKDAEWINDFASGEHRNVQKNV
jgi:hypothetical protein